MRRVLSLMCLVALAGSWVAAQQPAPARTGAPNAAAAPFTLTVDNIMRGPALVGAAPTGIRWSADSSKIFFSWQKAGEDRASNYVVNKDGSGLRPATPADNDAAGLPAGRYDAAHKRLLTTEGGDIVIYDATTRARRLVTRTSAVESNPRWALNDLAVTFMRDGNLFIVALAGNGMDPLEAQLTDVMAAPDTASAAVAAPSTGAAAGRGAGRGARGGGGGSQASTGEASASQQLLQSENLSLIDYLKQQANRGRQGGGAVQGAGGRGNRGGAPNAGGGPASTPIARFQLGARQTMTDLMLSPDGKYVFIGVTERPIGTARNQDVPNYVTSSAFPEMIPGRTNVGDVQSTRLLAMLDVKTGTSTWADASAFAGSERPVKAGDAPVARLINWGMPDTSDDGLHYVIQARAEDTKNRWFVTIDPATGKATVLDGLHDDAWIHEQAFAGGSGFGGGGGGGVAWLPDNKRFLFLSEKSGYMQIYSLDVTDPKPQAKALSTGKWEVTDARLSADRTKIFLTSNEVHPGERHFYTMSVDGGPRTKLTTMVGSHEATVSPDEKALAVVYSYSNIPPELYVMPMTAGAPMTKVTTTPSEEFRAFKWIDPKVFTYKARDGALVYARLLTPEMIGAKRDPKKPAVIFVHGAGYLQEAHKYWSTSYYRENMFNNLLASRGYVVLDPDYRASSGYGRDWRTAIYEHMGGKDLEDVVDGAKYLVDVEKVDPKRIGVYGGSYGGFITLMAMFTTPDVFAAGAALRPVTDWAHYNHGYTVNILNSPVNDMDAYIRSSPIYFADGLKGHLLICHGMVDTNVFFQDTVRLVQRLIELRKENWEVAPFPIENHSFTEETSWASEYKRILKLFEDNLRH